MAEKYHSESFLPHLTLTGVPAWAEERIVLELRKTAGFTSPFELSLKKVHCKNFPYQKITVEVEKSEVLNSLHQKTDKLFEGSYSKTEYLHISLLYSNLECEGLQQIVSEIKESIPQKIFLDRLALVHCKGTPEEWRTIYECKLNEIYR